MKVDKSKVFTLFALTLLIVSLVAINLNVPASAITQPVEPIYLHGPPLRPVHMHSSIALKPIHMHSLQGLIDLSHPRCTWWHELYPTYCDKWHLASWIDKQLPGDPGYDKLSPNDQIDMNRTLPSGMNQTEWYHVDRITVTILLSPLPGPPHPGNGDWPGPAEPTKAIELKWPEYDPDIIYRPLHSLWHEVWQNYSYVYNITSWMENVTNGVLDPCDVIDLTDVKTGKVSWWHVEQVATDLILRWKMKEPIGTWWQELYPFYDPLYDFELVNWEDTGKPYGWLSPSDQIEMIHWTTWYHVDRVTVTINVTDVITGKWMFLELKTYQFEEMYEVFKNPLYSLWHEVYPNYSNHYNLTSWDPMDPVFDNCNGVFDPCDYIKLLNMTSGRREYYHIEGMSYDLILNQKFGNPVGTDWWELYPQLWNQYHCVGWEDNHDGVLSPCDQVNLTFGLITKEYHVENVTLSINMTREGRLYIIECTEPFEEMYQVKTNPIGSRWTQWWVGPGSGSFPITGWIDNCNGVLDHCDEIQIGANWYHVEEVAVDMVVKEIPPVHDVAVTAVSSLYPWVYQGEIDPISVNVANLGDYNESTVDVYAFYDTNLAAPKITTSLNVGETKTLTFDWNTAGVPLGFYTISANATIPIDDVPGNNYLSDGQQEVREPPPTLYVDPPSVTPVVGSTFDINVSVRNVTAEMRLVFVRFRLTYSPDLLEVLRVTEGQFLRDPRWNRYGTWFGSWVEPDGVYGPHILVGQLLLPNTTTGEWEVFPYGGGTIATVTFRCKGSGGCALSLLDTELTNDTGRSIPHLTEDGRVDQYRMDLELYPRTVEDLGNPTCTQWHELHPSETNYYHLTGWIPGKVLSPGDQIDMYVTFPPVWIIFENASLFNPAAPICSDWRDPGTGEVWHLSSWEDTNGDGMLSVFDQIDMTFLGTGEVVWFHVAGFYEVTPGTWRLILDVKYWFQVDEVTVNMRLSSIPPGQPIFVEYKCGYWTFDPRNPICTKWNQIDGSLGPVRCLHLTNWNDTNGDGKLSIGDDIIDMKPLFPYSGPVEHYRVGSMSISLKLTPKQSPRVGPPPPDGPVYLESLISYDMFDLANPVCTEWVEIYPQPGPLAWHLSSWEDSLILSPSDQILLTLKDPETHRPIPGAEAWYHVDKLTVAMNLTSTYDLREHIVKFEGSLEQFKKYHWMDPNYTQWHEVNPNYSRQWCILSWEDTNHNDMLDYCDYIYMIDKVTGWTERFHVESLSTDIWVTQKICGVNITNVVPWFKNRVMNAAYRAWTIQVNVTVHNNGTIPLNCTVNVHCFNATFTYKIGTQNVTNLPPCNSVTLTFNWTMMVLRANTTYTLKANATCPCTASDEFVYGQVKVRLWGDVDDNGAINILDLKKVKLALSLLIDEPFADLDGDCDADILDLKKDKLILSGLLSPYGP